MATQKLVDYLTRQITLGPYAWLNNDSMSADLRQMRLHNVRAETRVPVTLQLLEEAADWLVSRGYARWENRGVMGTHHEDGLIYKDWMPDRPNESFLLPTPRLMRILGQGQWPDTQKDPPGRSQ